MILRVRQIYFQFESATSEGQMKNEHTWRLRHGLAGCDNSVRRVEGKEKLGGRRNFRNQLGGGSTR